MSIEAAATVERRFHNRFKATTTVRIRTKSGKQKLCKAINLSAEGVAVQTTDVGLKKDEEVELTFVINLGKISKMHRRKARVCHIHNGITGFAMMRYEDAKTIEIVVTG